MTNIRIIAFTCFTCILMSACENDSSSPDESGNNPIRVVNETVEVITIQYHQAPILFEITDVGVTSPRVITLDPGEDTNIDAYFNGNGVATITAVLGGKTNVFYLTAPNAAIRFDEHDFK